MFSDIWHQFWSCPKWYFGFSHFQWVARLWLGKKKVQKNDHALILKGSECMLFTLLNCRWRRYPIMLIDSRHFTDRRNATVCFHMRVTMAKRRYDIDYIKYEFSYIEEKRGEPGGTRPQSILFDFELKCSHCWNFSSLPSHSFVCFCLSLNLNFVSLDTLWYFILCQVQTATYFHKRNLRC